MSKTTLNIWGRDLDVDIVYDVYQGEEILKAQRDAYENFLAASAKLFAIAENEAKKYCIRINPDDIAEETITNIFRYVKPKAIFIKRYTGSERVVALLCAYKFNPDDGIAIVFKNETFAQIGTENIIL